VTEVPQVTFYFDLGSPYAYLGAERLPGSLSEPLAWQPVLLGGLFRLSGRSSWARGEERHRQAGIAEIERRARAYGLPAIVWPEPWPSDYLHAMRVATFAFAVGRGREFSTRAFRDAFQRGRDLGVAGNVLDAAEHAGLDRRDAEAAAQDPKIKRALRDATDAAHERGVVGVPTVAVDDRLFWGDDRLQEAAIHLEERARREDAPGQRHAAP
jgi:2-hydroxychromene-2-carboxylate isomerase